MRLNGWQRLHRRGRLLLPHVPQSVSGHSIKTSEPRRGEARFPRLLVLLSRYGSYDINNFLDDDQRQDMTSEPCPIPEGMTLEQYEAITRPVGGPHRELLEADPQLAAEHQRYIDSRLAELKAKYPEHDRRYPSSPRKDAA